MRENENEKIRKSMIEAYRQLALENHWDDVLQMSDEELLQMFALGEEEQVHVEEAPSCDSAALEAFIADLKMKIEELQEEIDFLSMAINDSDRHYMQITEFRSDLRYANRKIDEYRQKYDALLKKYYGYGSR